MPYSDIIGNADVSAEMLPAQIATEIIKTAPTSSALLSLARRTPMSRGVYKQPVLATRPMAYWVDGPTGLKQTSKATWENVTMTAEELAVIVPIPDSLVADSNVPLWDEIRPLVAEAIGFAVDQAALFGVNKPTSWPEALIPGAIAANQSIEAGTNADFAADVAALAASLASKGVAPSAFASEPGLNWRLIGMRDTTGQPIYAPSLAAGTPSTLYGKVLNEVSNGSWNSEVANLLAADWSKVVVGIRQDITYDLFKEGVITDENGAVVLNLMQQDTKALRVVFRVGYAVANPAQQVADGARTFPAGVIVPAAEAAPAP